MFMNQLRNLRPQQQQQQTFNPSSGQRVDYGEPFDPQNLQMTMPTGAAPSGNYGSPGQPGPVGLSLPSSGPAGQMGFQQMQMQQPQQQQMQQPQMQAPQQQRGVFTRPPQGTQNIGTRPNPSTAMNSFARGIQSGGAGQFNPIRPLGRR
jgi:hypothetical protein